MMRGSGSKIIQTWFSPSSYKHRDPESSASFRQKLTKRREGETTNDPTPFPRSDAVSTLALRDGASTRDQELRFIVTNLTFLHVSKSRTKRGLLTLLCFKCGLDESCLERQRDS